MATYRRATTADANTIATWATTPSGSPARTPIQAIRAMGYEMDVPTLAQLQYALGQTRQYWGLAFDNSNNLRAIITAYTINRPTDKCVWIAFFLADNALSLANLRTHRNAVMNLIRSQIPDGFLVKCWGVPLTAVRANEYLTAYFGAPEVIGGKNYYNTTIEAWRLVP